MGLGTGASIVQNPLFVKTTPERVGCFLWEHESPLIDADENNQRGLAEISVLPLFEDVWAKKMDGTRLSPRRIIS